MKKRCIILVFVISAIVLCFLTFDNNKHLNDFYISDEDYRNIIESRTLTNELKIDNIYFDEYKLFNTEDGLYFYSLIEDSSTRYNPKVSFDNNDINIRFCGDEIDDNLIEENKHIKIVAYNKTEYNEFELVCTTLPIMSIYGIDLDLVEENEGGIEIFDNSNSSLIRYVSKECKVSARGSYSKINPKKNIKISLIENSVGENKRKTEVSIFGLEKGSDYILNAAFEDATKARNVFTSNLWLETCKTDSKTIDYGFSYKYVELIINNKYHGLYAISNKIDADYLKLENDEAAYKRKTLKYSDYDYFEEGSPCLNDYVIKTNSKEDLSNGLDEYYRILMSTNETNYDELYAYFDIENNMDYYLFVNLIQGIDNWSYSRKSTHNLYIIAKMEQNYYKYYIMPYDYDLSWGKDFSGQLSTDYNVDVEFSATHLLLYLEDGFKEKMVDEYFKLRESCWSDETIIAMIDDCEDKVFNSGAFKREKERWPNEEYGASGFVEEENLSEFKDYIIERLHYLDEYYSCY